MIILIIQARMASTRLPGKVMFDLVGEPMLWRIIERARKAMRMGEVVVATTMNAEDNVIESFCQQRAVPVFRGSAEDVLARYYQTARAFNANTIVRITADCPLIDPCVIDRCVEAFQSGNYDYVSNNTIEDTSTFPRGLEVEVISFTALETAAQDAQLQYQREHVTPYIWENKDDNFFIGPVVSATPEYRRAFRLTVDYPEDFSLMQKIYERFHKGRSIISVPEVLLFLDKNPDWVAINVNCIQKRIK